MSLKNRAVFDCLITSFDCLFFQMKSNIGANFLHAARAASLKAEKWCYGRISVGEISTILVFKTATTGLMRIRVMSDYGMPKTASA